MFAAPLGILDGLQSNRCPTNPLPLFLFSRVLSGGGGFNIDEDEDPSGRVRASNDR